MSSEKSIESNYGYNSDNYKEMDCMKEYGKYKVKVRDSKDTDVKELKPDAVTCAYNKYKYESGNDEQDFMRKSAHKGILADYCDNNTTACLSEDENGIPVEQDEICLEINACDDGMYITEIIPLSLEFFRIFQVLLEDISPDKAAELLKRKKSRVSSFKKDQAQVKLIELESIKKKYDGIVEDEKKKMIADNKCKADEVAANNTGDIVEESGEVVAGEGNAADAEPAEGNAGGEGNAACDCAAAGDGANAPAEGGGENDANASANASANAGANAGVKKNSEPEKAPTILEDKCDKFDIVKAVEAYKHYLIWKGCPKTDGNNEIIKEYEDIMTSDISTGDPPKKNNTNKTVDEEANENGNGNGQTNNTKPPEPTNFEPYKNKNILFDLIKAYIKLEKQIDQLTTSGTVSKLAKGLKKTSKRAWTKDKILTVCKTRATKERVGKITKKSLDAVGTLSTGSINAIKDASEVTKLSLDTTGKVTGKVIGTTGKVIDKTLEKTFVKDVGKLAGTGVVQGATKIREGWKNMRKKTKKKQIKGINKSNANA